MREYLKKNVNNNKHIAASLDNRLCLNDNTTLSALQKKQIMIMDGNVLSPIVQMFRGFKVGGDVMREDDYHRHIKNANKYYVSAFEYINTLKDGIPKVVAHHNGQNKICGAGTYAGAHAELQILQANLGTPFLEMGITSPMCGANKYPNFPEGCQATIQGGYENNKVIFAREPKYTYLFPHGGQERIDANSIAMKYYCAGCCQELQRDTGFCPECMAKHAAHVDVKVNYIDKDICYIVYINIISHDGNAIRIQPFIPNLKFDDQAVLRNHIIEYMNINRDYVINII